MFKSHEMIPSRAMGRRMHLWRYGHFGDPILVFPSAAGMAHEWEAHGMLETLGDLIDGGKIKLYCSESNVAEAWTRKEEGHAAQRIEKHLAFEQYVLGELVPWIREDCKSPEIPLSVTGTSLGAFYSANFALKRATVFRWALCMSGRYDATWLTDGYTDTNVYFNNPLAYVPNMEGSYLDEVRANTHLTLVCGQGKWEGGNIEDTQRFAGVLASKTIPHQLDLWGHDVSHEWTWWQRQARHHIEARLRGGPLGRRP